MESPGILRKRNSSTSTAGHDELHIVSDSAEVGSIGSDFDDRIRSVSVKSAGYDEPDSELCSTGGFSKKMFNVLLLGLGFMFNVGALQTCVMAQTVVLNSVKDEYFEGTPTMGYVCMAVNCASQALAYLLGPSICAVVGPKAALVAGSVCVSLYISCFLRPLAVTIYAGSVLVGFGVGTIWAVQGHFVAINSRRDSVTRNTGIFWGLFQSSLISGNLFYFFMLRGAETIEVQTRITVFTTLLVVSAIGTVFFCLIIHPWTAKKSDAVSQHSNADVKTTGPKAALVAILRLGISRKMLILVPHFFYIGMECTFWASVYSTSIGYTRAFGIMRQSLVGLNGVFLGIGEILASFSLGFLGKWSTRHGKDKALIFGMLTHFAAFYLIFLNLPAESPLHLTDEYSFIGPNPYLAMFCTILLGIGDAVWTNQLMAYLESVYPRDCVSAFGVYQFYCAIINSAAFWYSTVLTLPFQLLLLTAMAVPAAIGFCLAEWKATRFS